MNEFKIGDTVRLKSGGPLMTVTDLDNSIGYLLVYCTWFDEKGDQKYTKLKPQTLELED